MRSLTRCIVLALVCSVGAFAQIYDHFTVSYTTPLSGATTAVAVQLPLTGSYGAEVVDVSVQCSAACPIRFEVNSETAAGAGNSTALPVVSLNPDSTPAALVATPNLTAWVGPNVPAGTVVSPVWNLPPGALVPFGGGRLMVSRTTPVNYIVRVPTNTTTTVTFYFLVRVRR